MALKNRPVPLTSVSESNSFAAIHNNFQKLQTELNMMRRSYGARIAQGEKAKEILDYWLGPLPSMRFQEAQERIEEAERQLEEAQKRLDDAYKEISNVQYELNNREAHLQEVAQRLQDAESRLRRRVENLEPVAQSGTWLYAPPISFSRNSKAYVIEGSAF